MGVGLPSMAFFFVSFFVGIFVDVLVLNCYGVVVGDCSRFEGLGFSARCVHWGLGQVFFS